MPLGESQSRIYVSIIDGEFAVRSSEDDHKALKRVTKSGHTVHERRYRYLTGKLKDILFKNEEFNGKKWEELHLLVYDGTDHFILKMPFPGRYSNSFLRAIKNADLSKDIQFNPWTKEVDGRTKAAIYMNQGGKESVPWYYTTDVPNGLPDLEPYKLPDSDEVKYSDIKRNKFLRAMVANDLAPKLRELWKVESAVPAAGETFEAPDLNEPIDDLPF